MTMISPITVLVGLALADPGDWRHMGGWGWGMAIFGWLFMAVVVALVIWLVAITVRGSGPVRRGERGALNLLDERYARGEIDREEYLQRRADLEG